MKKTRLIPLLLLLFGIYGFNGSAPKQSQDNPFPDDFYFRINSGENDSYDSKTGTFNRKYAADEKAIKVELTKEEKEKIYAFAQKLQFFKMPDKFEPKEDTVLVSDPSFVESIAIYTGGKQKTASYDTGQTSEQNKKRAGNFFRLYDLIWTILKSKKEVVDLPASDLYYK